MSCAGRGARLLSFWWGPGFPRFCSRAFFCPHFLYQSLRIRNFLLVTFYLLIVTLIPAAVAMADDELAPLAPIPDKGSDDELAPLIPIPDKGPDDELAPLTISSDSSNLLGLQIRPPNATLMTARSIDLEIKNCFSYNPESGSSHIECDEIFIAGNAEQYKKLINFKASKWSVNGIEGGNTVVGRVTANGADGKEAIYTAPDNVPNPATVAVSTEIATQGKSKVLVQANITIIKKAMLVSVKFSGAREQGGETINYAGTASLNYVRADVFNGGIRYDLEPRSVDTHVRIDKWDMHSDSLNCQLKQAVTSPSPMAPYTGNFLIYTNLNSYVMGALIEMLGSVECKDGDSTYIEEVTPRILLTTSKGPPDPGFQPIAKDGSFKGKSILTMPLDEDNEEGVKQSMEWTAKKYE